MADDPVSEKEYAWLLDELSRSIHDFTPRELHRLFQIIEFHFELKADDG